MNRIRLLPEHVANQIAAGEVVERPASVVKELVENALDARPTQVTVEVAHGGRSLIRVTDDGIGMGRDDALLCFERHATSKIARAEDLDAIATMGFRGEALPSIASVSRLALTTRDRAADAIEATQVIIHGGKIVEVRTAAGPVGTCVEVRNLFFNLPARRKFLKSEETERSHIHHYLLLAALAFPEVGFTFTDDQRLVWQLPALPGATDPAGRQQALRERLRALYGSDLNLVAIDRGGPLPVRGEPETDPGFDSDLEASMTLQEVPSAIRLWGFIGAPGVSRATREDQHLFVNRRPVDHRGLQYALIEGYHTSLMKGRYPVCCLFLELSPALVDVNVHPAKREVRFREEWSVRRFVANTVRQALLDYHVAHPGTTPVAPTAPLPTVPDPILPSAQTELEYIRPTPNPSPAAPPVVPPQVVADPVPPAFSPEPKLTQFRSDDSQPPIPAPPPAASRTPAAPAIPGTPTPPPPLASGPRPLLAIPLRLVGVIGKLYGLLESDRGLVLLDQHAAHERVLFEQMLTRLERGDAPCQRLLLAETVELAPRDAAFLREQLPMLTRLGVSLSEFGERTFLLDGLPPFVRATDPRRFVLELVDALKAVGQEVNAMRLGEDVVAKTVCRHAVKANDPLAGTELERLIEDLRRCAMPYTCPHGRPTLIEFNYRELERRFGRSQ